MADHLVKATVPGVRAFAAVTTALSEEARRRHDCWPVATAALGRTMTAALLMAANLKTDEYVTVRIAGDGPLGGISADAHALGTVRGYVRNPHTDLPLADGKLAVGRAVGEGHIHVTRFTELAQKEADDKIKELRYDTGRFNALKQGLTARYGPPSSEQGKYLDSRAWWELGQGYFANVEILKNTFKIAAADPTPQTHPFRAYITYYNKAVVDILFNPAKPGAGSKDY